MTARTAVACLLLVGCDRYEVALEPVGFTPVPVVITDSRIEIPSGILATVVARIERNGSPDDDAFVTFDSGDVDVLDVAPVDSEWPNEFGLLAVQPGRTTLLVVVEGSHTFAWPTTITPQE